MSTLTRTAQHPREQLLARYGAIRRQTLAICAPLEAEDACIQTMPDVSPPKWHLAHTSWFFETFLLLPYAHHYKAYHPAYDYLFNSYYLTHGQPYPRAQRGLLSRPSLREILDYRAVIDDAMQDLITRLDEQRYVEFAFLLELGLNHEQQHQELLYTDIKHILAHNPMRPAYIEAGPTGRIPGLESNAPVPPGWLHMPGGIIEVGDAAGGFAYDNEGPRHRVLLQDFTLAKRLVTNAEYLEFINDGGYQRPEFWLSEGWSASQVHGWSAPLYWEHDGTDWMQFGFWGMQAIEPNAAVCHVSFYEADAYARWAGKRLPTEFEWEHVASGQTIAGNLREQGALQTRPAQSAEVTQLYGDAWEWTASPYGPYPGYRPAAGSIGEYNGKFMCSQMVLRGGSFATPQAHIRASYRNFFYPADRWQFSGIRLAEDA
jgi:ergothioneine biosynthesis protein EgtB